MKNPCRAIAFVALVLGNACGGALPARDAGAPAHAGRDAGTAADAGDSGTSTDAGTLGSCNDADCVTPTVCAPGSAEVSFRRQSTPPATMVLWQSSPASVTFANCGTSTWSATTSLDQASGFKIGSRNPDGNDRFGLHRVLLPADVPPSSEVTVQFTVAPLPLTGIHT